MSTVASPTPGTVDRGHDVNRFEFKYVVHDSVARELAVGLLHHLALRNIAFAISMGSFV